MAVTGRRRSMVLSSSATLLLLAGEIRIRSVAATPSPTSQVESASRNAERVLEAEHEQDLHLGGRFSSPPTPSSSSRSGRTKSKASVVSTLELKSDGSSFSAVPETVATLVSAAAMESDTARDESKDGMLPLISSGSFSSLNPDVVHTAEQERMLTANDTNVTVITTTTTTTTTSTTTTTTTEVVTLAPPWEPPVDYWGGAYATTTADPNAKAQANLATTTTTTTTRPENVVEYKPTDFVTLAPSAPLPDMPAYAKAGGMLTDPNANAETTTPEPKGPVQVALSSNATAVEDLTTLRQDFACEATMRIPANMMVDTALALYMSDTQLVNAYEEGACTALRTNPSQVALDCTKVVLKSMTNAAMTTALSGGDTLNGDTVSTTSAAVGQTSGGVGRRGLESFHEKLVREASRPEKVAVTSRLENTSSSKGAPTTTLTSSRSVLSAPTGAAGAKVLSGGGRLPARYGETAAERVSRRTSEHTDDSAPNARQTAQVHLNYEIEVVSTASATSLVADIRRTPASTFVAKLNLALTEAEMSGLLDSQTTEIFPVITGLKTESGDLVQLNVTQAGPPRIIILSSDAAGLGLGGGGGFGGGMVVSMLAGFFLPVILLIFGASWATM
eukprot:CAMPEP_0179009960 /NCGR_PEP_ID=MMETSP0795-20121207/16548_1 /TAXON_ID=88552 /ORGANISM="Amoebophrya sp., Strain Ameob2" /LENGTH=617 /DNA_ID=CAMNT_0020705187 /DNA_START=294 /DNA_END=2147 /DNA_ORIENTATION=+